MRIRTSRPEDARRTVWARLGLGRRQRRLISAVDRVSLTIELGETIGYLGPNGAGKSTTVKMLAGVLVPSSGRLTVGGLRSGPAPTG